MTSSPKIIHIGLWKIKKDANPKAVAELDKQVMSFKSTIPEIELAHAGPLETFHFPQEIVDTLSISPDTKFWPEATIMFYSLSLKTRIIAFHMTLQSHTLTYPQ